MLGVLNARSTRNKIERIRDIIIEQDLDILALTETWLTSKVKDEFFVKGLSLSGYKLFNVPRKANKGYGGVALLYKANLQVTAKSSTDGWNSFEHCTMTFTANSRCLNIVVVYRPPPSKKNGLTCGQFFEEFPLLLGDHLSTAGDLILVGDVNFHLDVLS